MPTLTLPQQNIRQMQQRFGDGVCALHFSVRFPRELSRSRLQAAWNTTLAQTDALRLSITDNGDETQQSFGDAPGLLRLAGQAPRPLWQAAWRESRGRTLLNFHCHHLIADAWGLYTLADRLRHNYHDQSAPIGTYAHFIAADAAYRASDKRTRAFAYFADQLAQCPNPVFLASKLHPSLDAKRWTVTLTQAQTERIYAQAQRAQTTPYALFLYALGKAVADVRGAQRLFLGTTVLNRTGAQEKNTVGMFVNTVPVLIDTAAGAEGVSAGLVGVFRHQRCGYVDLLAQLRHRYGLQGGLFDVMLNYQNIRTDLDGAAVQWHFHGQQSETLQLHIHDWGNTGALTLDYDYRTALLTAHDVRRLHRAVLSRC
ncbi:MAG: condensation domain-containing protein [Oscillospiraceae bacterium]|jgi:hypothetical protein|nr:condensation domain-containing protein [Oscillospiraceae bacterium]